MSAGIQFSGFLDGHTAIVVSTFGWPNNWAVEWTVHAQEEPPQQGLSPPRMGLVLPAGAEAHDGGQTYFLLVQNAGDHGGSYDLVVQFEQF